MTDLSKSRKIVYDRSLINVSYSKELREYLLVINCYNIQIIINMAVKLLETSITKYLILF